MKKILVIGDFMLDETFTVDVERISAEAPVIIIDKLEEEPKRRLGGAGLAAQFLCSICQEHEVLLLAPVPYNLEKKITIPKNLVLLESIPSENTIVKQRFIHKKLGYQVARIDNDKTITVFPLKVKDLKTVIEDIKKDIEFALFLDYNKGFLSDLEEIKNIVKYLNNIGIETFVDSKSNSIDHFLECSFIKLNEKEIHDLIKKEKEENIISFYAKKRIKNLLITQGEKGATLFSHDKIIKNPVSIRINSGIPYVSGCGDIFDSVFCYCYYILKEDIETALNKAVKRASCFAYQPIGEL